MKNCSRSYAETDPGSPALSTLEQIVTAPLALKPSLKGFHGAGLVFIELDPAPTRSAKAAPRPDQGRSPKQAGRERQDVVASHVAAWIKPVQDQIVDRVVSHAPVSRGPLDAVQSES